MLELDSIILKKINLSTENLIIPYSKSIENIEYEAREIIEWQNYNSTIAQIKGKVYDTYGLYFIATDYKENKAEYQNNEKLRINFSAIGLGIYDREETDQELKMAKDACGYLPYADMMHLSCFHFYGEIVGVTETKIDSELDDKVYLVKMQLTRSPDDKIEPLILTLFYNKLNVRCSELQKGKLVAGVFQLLGEIEQ